MTSTGVHSLGKIVEEGLRPQVEFTWIRQEHPDLLCGLFEVDLFKALGCAVDL